MATVLVTGIPHVKMSKVLFVLKATFAKNRLPKTFWIQEFLDDRETNMKKMLIAFETIQDASDARRFLDGFIYRLGSAQYVFAARTIEDNRRHRSPGPVMRYRERSPVRQYERFDRRYTRSRSRSPLHHRADASDLDLEIELLRKRRLIIEEERRLLLERKKLELVKEYGPTAAKEFSYLDDHERKYEPRSYERRPYERERRRSVERFRRRSVERARPARRPRSPPNPKRGLPFFVLPCKLLIESMKHLIAECSNKKESTMLEKLIRSTLRKRIAVALEGKGRMSTSSIISLYRKFYPETTDEAFVKKLTANIKASYISDLITDKTGTKEKEEKNVNTDKKGEKKENSDEKKKNSDEKENNEEVKEVTEEKETNDDKKEDTEEKETNDEKKEDNEEKEINEQKVKEEKTNAGGATDVNDVNDSDIADSVMESKDSVKEIEDVKEITTQFINDSTKELKPEQNETSIDAKKSESKEKEWVVEGGTDWNEDEVPEVKKDK